MVDKIAGDKLRGVWSAAPTPFDSRMGIDVEALERMVEHHIKLGVTGIFLAGTCGEGPWLPERDRRTLVKVVSKCAGENLIIAVQVTDNSYARILDNIEAAREDGADVAVIAPPYFLMNATSESIRNLYIEAIRRSTLPVCVYDRGSFSSILVAEAVLEAAYAEEKVIMIKDSSGTATRREVALAARRKRPELKLFNGTEFDCVNYLTAGYDGLLLGGGIFNAYLAGKIMETVAAGDMERAETLQERMNDMMHDVYGGRDNRCWLSGLKKLLVEMGIFSTWKSYLDYPLTAECIESINEVMTRDRDVLFPYRL